MQTSGCRLLAVHMAEHINGIPQAHQTIVKPHNLLVNSNSNTNSSVGTREAL